MTLQKREIKKLPFINTLIYGPAKTGKTAGVASVVEFTGEAMLLNADTENASRFSHARYPGKLHEYEVQGLQTLIDVTHAVLQGGQIPGDTVIIDTLSDMYRKLLEGFAGQGRPSLQMYGDASLHFERFIRFLCDQPVNLLLVAHDLKVSSDLPDGGQEVKWLPFTGSSSNPTLGQKIAGMVDVVGYSGVVKTAGELPVYMAQLCESRGRLGGDRFNVIADPKIGAAPMQLGDWYARIHEGAMPSPPKSDAKSEKKEKK